MFDRHFAVWPQGVPRHLTLPETSLYENLAISARRFPHKAAILYYGTPLTYAALQRDVGRLAGYLEKACGVKKADRVLLYMQNSPQFVIAYYAIQRLTAVVVPVNPMSRTEELRHIASDTGASTIVCGQEIFEFAKPLLDSGLLQHAIIAAYGDYVREQTDLALPDVVAAPRIAVSAAGAVAWMDALAAGLEAGPHRATPDDWCVLPYSSGTTGAPKGCLHSIRSVTATLFAYVAWKPGSPEAVHLVTLPLFHVTGMQNSMNTPIFAGATMVMMTRWDRRTAAELIRRHRVTQWRSITTMAIDFLSDPEVASFDLSSLTGIGGGGAAMPGPVAAKLKELTGLDYIEGYGLSETIAATHINPHERPKPQCLGIPIFDVDSRVINPDTMEELGPNETGEIVVSGPQIFLGYWNRPEETAAVFFERDGKRFFRTGDLGYYDEEGYFFLVDRLKRMINASGFKVWPTEIEGMMYAHPGIREVCIIAAPDAHRGETVKAVIVPKDDATDLTPESIQAWCRERMAAYKVPRIITFADSLPKSGSGKILWRVLQDEERRKAAMPSAVA
ncbi:long-chain fatty acid--CoA ligase [uncultured Ferrovibrio sp.]|jgi:Acyl-CoA synthetases (AMP-forming)/AMP-acid ligases II|uniref:long-chain fatty acid--CoA ligase n=1 Tax=uncultured Ferrovibrio sp. TaxID=1576913 RepID=UPI0026069BA3|nr:long-chain fatty acid--CoA ligase [uncultured Ferrovibrio sp.]